MDGGDFPRGGGGTQKRSYDESTNNNTDDTTRGTSKSKDFLFDTTSSSDKRRRSDPNKNATIVQQQPSSTIGSLGQLGGGGVVRRKFAVGLGTSNLVIGPISFSKLHAGMKLLGIVRQVTDDYAVISLPNMLTGYVRRKKEVCRSIL